MLGEGGAGRWGGGVCAVGLVGGGVALSEGESDAGAPGAAGVAGVQEDGGGWGGEDGACCFCDVCHRRKERAFRGLS